MSFPSVRIYWLTTNSQATSAVLASCCQLTPIFQDSWPLAIIGSVILIFILPSFLFWGMVPRCVSGWPGAQSIAQAGLSLMTVLTQPPPQGSSLSTINTLHPTHSYICRWQGVEVAQSSYWLTWSWGRELTQTPGNVYRGPDRKS